MDIGTLLRRWLDLLAATYFAQCETWRSRRALVVTCENSRIVIRKASADGNDITGPEQPIGQDPAVAVVGAGKRVSPDVLRLARSGLVILELPSENVVVRRI